MTEDTMAAPELDRRPTVVPLLSPREVGLTDQLDAASRTITALEVKVNRLELELIAARAQAEELAREVADLRAIRRSIRHPRGRRSTDAD